MRCKYQRFIFNLVAYDHSSSQLLIRKWFIFSHRFFCLFAIWCYLHWFDPCYCTAYRSEWQIIIYTVVRIYKYQKNFITSMLITLMVDAIQLSRSADITQCNAWSIFFSFAKVMSSTLEHLKKKCFDIFPLSFPSFCHHWRLSFLYVRSVPFVILVLEWIRCGIKYCRNARSMHAPNNPLFDHKKHSI